MCNVLSYLFLCFDNGIAVFLQATLEIICSGAHRSLEEHGNVREGWGGLSLFSINNVVTLSFLVPAKTKHLPMQSPPPV